MFPEGMCSNDVCCLIELILYVPVNSNGHVGTLSPFNGTFTQQKDVMTFKMCTMCTFKHYVYTRCVLANK